MSIPPPDAPVSAAPLPLPTGLVGTWQREARLHAELVGPGMLRLESEGVAVSGRRTGPVRGTLWGALALGMGVATLALLAAVVLTTVGMGWRTRSWQWALGTACLGLPLTLIVRWLVRTVGRRLLEPAISLRVAWADVHRVSSDGRSIELELTAGRQRVVGRLVPQKLGGTHSAALLGIQGGGLPGGLGGISTRALRPVWIDRSFRWLALGGALAAAWTLEPRVSTFLLGLDEARSGPLAGIPPALTRPQVEARAGGPCAGAAGDSPTLRNRRDGADLVWSVDGDAADWQVAVVRGRAGTSRLDLLGLHPAATGRSADFFMADAAVGITGLVASDHAQAAARVLAGGDAEALRAAVCAGLVARVDVARSPAQAPAPAPEVAAHRSGDDLFVRAPDDLGGGWNLLAVRWRDRPGPDLFDVCEVPQHEGAVGLLPLRPQRRLRGFFGGPGEEARIYLVHDDQQPAAHALADEGTVQRCLVPDSLLWSGVAAARVTTRDDRSAALRDAAAAAARRAPLAPMGSSAATVLDAVVRRYASVRHTLGAAGRPRAERDAIDAGFLDAVDWALLLDSVSFTRSLPRLEAARQRLTGLDPAGAMGTRFLMRFAEEFLDRVPLPRGDMFAYGRRIEVAEDWLDITPGHTWTLGAGRVRVPDQAAADTYQVIGRFVLMDVARRLETDLERGHADLPGTVGSLVVRWQLQQHDITIDVARSSARKGLEAWVTGDFEYLADRLTKKAAERLRDEQAAVNAARSARYSLVTEFSDGAAVRMSHLHRDRRAIGWVAQVDQARARLGWSPRAGASPLPSPLVLATAGSYVTADGRTAGLSVVSGRVENYLVSPDMDGLVVVRGSGELVLMDLDAGAVLPGDGRRVRPLRSLSDFHTLLAWLERDSASAFQTHLLAADGALSIDGEKSSGELRERRLLVEASFRGHPIVVLVDIPGAHKKSLYEAAVVTWQALTTPEDQGGPGLQVRAIANLDVGSFDILRAWDDRGAVLRSSPKGLDAAHNLLTVQL